MKKHIKRLLVFIPILILTSLLFRNIFSFSTGYIGVTNKGGEGIGCICHGTNMPTPSVSVFFEGPDSVSIGQTVQYKVKIAHGPAVVGGFDAAVFAGRLDTLNTGTEIWKDSTTGDLTHRYPKQFINDTVHWSFKYTAPSIPQVDTLYAVGNSTNNDSTSGYDEWNFSPNFIIHIYNQTGISNQNTIAQNFKLYQNYPNPFNPYTTIQYNIPSSGNVSIEIYDITGKIISLNDIGYQSEGTHKFEFDGSNYATGIYFYELSYSSDNPSKSKLHEVKKMMLVK